MKTKTKTIARQALAAEYELLEEQFNAAVGRAEKWKLQVELWRGIDWQRIIAWLRSSGTAHVRGGVEGAIGMINAALNKS